VVIRYLPYALSDHHDPITLLVSPVIRLVSIPGRRSCLNNRSCNPSAEAHSRTMLGEIRNRFSLTRAASTKGEGKFLSISISTGLRSSSARSSSLKPT
jgi:hypothetical protein